MEYDALILQLNDFSIQIKENDQNIEEAFYFWNTTNTDEDSTVRTLSCLVC